MNLLTFETTIYEIHKYFLGISETKGDYKEHIVTISGSECHFSYILTSHHMLVIPRSQVNLTKVYCPFELIKQVVNLRERILVLLNDFIELAIINAHSKGPILLLQTKLKHHEEILGIMKPLSRKSLS